MDQFPFIHCDLAATDGVGPEYYSQNTFQIEFADRGLKWIKKITPANMKMLRKIRILVCPVYNMGPETFFLTNKPPNGPQWIAILDKLATEAVNLQEMHVYLDADAESFALYNMGAAVDVDFVRALARMPNLEKLTLRGFFPKGWPAYLKEKTGLTVWEEEGEKHIKNLREFQQLLYDQDLSKPRKKRPLVYPGNLAHSSR